MNVILLTYVVWLPEELLHY